MTKPAPQMGDLYAIEHVAGAATARQQFVAYCASLKAMGLGKLALIGLLVMLGSFTDAIGIVLLIPFLEMAFAGLAQADGGANGGTGGGSAADWLAPWMSGIAPDWRLAALIGFYLALLILRAVVAWQRDLRLQQFSMQLVDSWRTRLVNAIAAANWRRLQEIHFSRLEFALLNDVSRLSMGSDRILRGMVAVVQLTIMVALAVRLSPTMMLVTAGLILLATPVLLPVVQRARAYGSYLSKQGSQRQAVLADFMQGMKLAKAHDAEHRHADAFLALTREITQRTRHFTDLQLRAQNAFQVFGGLIVAGIAIYGLTRSTMSPAELMAFIVLCSRIIPPVQVIVGAVQTITTMLPAVGGLLSMEAELADDARTSFGQVTGSKGNEPAALEIVGVGYTPPGRDTPVLVDCSATIPAGGLTLLLGPSGSGKTTLVDILLGLVAPETGTLAVDGTVLEGETARAVLRADTAYVPQDPFLFDTTLRENLLWAAPDASEADMWHALDQAEATAFVRRLPQGLDTRPGNRGGSLSGGERQRLCLARALLRRPRLLILDEATSAMDTIVEDRLVETLMRLRGQTTILMIAHRLPGGLVPDHVLRIEQGRLTG